MEELHSALKIVLADTFTMYLKTQSFHWNVIGPNFSQYRIDIHEKHRWMLRATAGMKS